MKEEIIIAGFGGQGVFRIDGRQRGDLDAGLRTGTTWWYSQRNSHRK